MRFIQAIIFDMDGLMVDSEPLARQAWQQVLSVYQLTLEDDLYRQMIGLRLDESARFLKEKLNLAASPIQLGRQKEQYLSQLRAEGVPPMAGLKELMVEISRRHVPWAVATSSPRDHAVAVLGRLNYLSSCKAIAAGDEVDRGKPAPDIYLLAAERLDEQPSKCLSLEDSGPGAKAAKAAGTRTIVVPNEQTNDQNFEFVYKVYGSLIDVAQDLDELLNAEF